MKLHSRESQNKIRRMGLATLIALLELSTQSHDIHAQSLEPSASGVSVYGPELEGFTYPYPIHLFPLTSQKQTLHMVYMDVASANPNGRVAVLMHGKNFCSATWRTSIEVLSKAGYRVVAADQIGFCKSTKPASYQYSFQQLANNTHALLESLGIRKAILIAHSTGGMIAIRYALMYPEATEQLVLVDPIGLEDWKAKGVPAITADQWYERELRQNADAIRQYERTTYYAGTWKDSYEEWVQMLAGMYRGPGKELVAWNSALLYDMIYTQPVFYEIDHLTVPTLLIIGDRDNTAIGKEFAPPEIRVSLGNYPVLAKQAAARIAGARLVEFPALGHSPQLQDPDAFHKALLKGLAEHTVSR
jgi:pimeloyl-ACP methyl ester carboxylesterase